MKTRIFGEKKSPNYLLMMIGNYFEIMLRNMAGGKSYTAINILGLTLGIACALSIFLYVYDELTYDRHHKNCDNIFRINGFWKSVSDGSSEGYPQVGYIVTEHFKKDFPEVAEMTRVMRWGLMVQKPGTKEQVEEQQVVRVEPNLFRVFTLPLIYGNGRNLLSEPNTVVLTRKMALKYFNREDVVGESLTTYGQDTLSYKITGVIEDYPDNTHLKWDFLLPFPQTPPLEADWFEYRYATYFTLKPNTAIKAVEKKIRFFTKPYVAAEEKLIGYLQEHSITPLSRVHLYSHLVGENNADAKYLGIFFLIGVFILAMACINYMNLATARSMKRAKEIGLRKVIGAARSQLIRQFLGESFFITTIAAVLSIGAIDLLLPLVNSWSGKNLNLFNNPVFWSMLAGIMVVVALLSGSYPAFMISGFKPSETLKGNLTAAGKGALLRKALVVFQFVISVSLIAGTLVVNDHLHFLRSKSLGFDQEQVLLVRAAPPNVKEQVLKIAGVAGASFSHGVPGTYMGANTIQKGWAEGDPLIVVGKLIVDHDFINLYKLRIVEGRGFDKNYGSDATEAFMINESAVSKLGYANAKDAIGKPLYDDSWDEKKGRIIGVIKDFHFAGVNSAIEPFCMYIHPEARNYLSIKIASDNIPAVLDQVEKVYSANVPGRKMEYSFLDEDFDKQYQIEDRFQRIFSLFAAVGIVISCLGLYGLTLFMAVQRTKEAGIRKVLGASGRSILALFTSDFLKLVLVSTIIAIPLAYWGMEKWLTSFPYREKINPLLFVDTTGLVLLIALLTVGVQAMRVASVNPARAVRAE